MKDMTQKEYDDRMNLLRRQETEEKYPIEVELQQLTQQRRYLGQQIVLLNAQMGGVRQRIAELIAQRKQIGGRYYEEKKQLIKSLRL